jgi:hypothetical protein
MYGTSSNSTVCAGSSSIETPKKRIGPSPQRFRYMPPDASRVLKYLWYSSPRKNASWPISKFV